MRRHHRPQSPSYDRADLADGRPEPRGSVPTDAPDDLAGYGTAARWRGDDGGAAVRIPPREEIVACSDCHHRGPMIVDSPAPGDPGGEESARCPRCAARLVVVDAPGEGLIGHRRL